MIDKRCISVAQICNNRNDCADGSDEMQCGSGMNIESNIHRSTSAQYTVGVVVGAVAMLFIFIFLWFTCRRRGFEGGIVVQLDSSHSPMIIKASQTYSTAPHTTLTNCRGQASGTTFVSGLSGSTRLYDRTHITGASSSSSAMTQYPHETLNPPPSPVTDRSYVGVTSSATDSTLMAYWSQLPHRTIPPPPTTPCSTDIADDNSSYTHPCHPPLRHHYHSNHKYKHKARHKQSSCHYNTMNSESYCDISDSTYLRQHNRYYPNRTATRGVLPRTHASYLSQESSVYSPSPSPSTERSYFNPFPPPPSPEVTSDQE